MVSLSVGGGGIVGQGRSGSGSACSDGEYGKNVSSCEWSNDRPTLREYWRMESYDMVCSCGGQFNSADVDANSGKCPMLHLLDRYQKLSFLMTSTTASDEADERCQHIRSIWNSFNIGAS